jgi:hypothetical protein
VTYLVGKALCERPFPFYLIDTEALDGGLGPRVEARTLEEASIPGALPVSDAAGAPPAIG